MSRLLLPQMLLLLPWGPGSPHNPAIKGHLCGTPRPLPQTFSSIHCDGSGLCCVAEKCAGISPGRQQVYSAGVCEPMGPGMDWLTPGLTSSSPTFPSSHLSLCLRTGRGRMKRLPVPPTQPEMTTPEDQPETPALSVPTYHTWSPWAAQPLRQPGAG